MTDLPEARPLTGDERALLEHLLRLDRPGMAELRTQAEHARVVVAKTDAYWIALDVPRDSSPPANVDSDDVSRALSKDMDDPEAGLVILFVDEDGYLDRIEVTSWDAMPTRLPAPEDLQPAY